MKWIQHGVEYTEEVCSRLGLPCIRAVDFDCSEDCGHLHAASEDKPVCIILNGPPGSGKDAIAELMPYPYLHLEFKAELFKQAFALSGVTEGEWFDRYNNRELKEQPWWRLRGKSQREYLIWISEVLVKPNEGVAYYGEKAAELALSYEYRNIVFSDGGFTEEIPPMQEAYRANLFIIHLHREGCTFDGDSRDYIQGMPNTHVIENNGPLYEAVQKILSIIKG